MSERTGADEVIDHLVNCADVNAALVMHQGSADDAIAELVAAGWTLEERVDRVAGKRIRYMQPPPGVTLPSLDAADGGDAVRAAVPQPDGSESE